jgi:hypothetical protein
MCWSERIPRGKMRRPARFRHTGNVGSDIVAPTFLNLCIEPGLMEKAMSVVGR